MIDWNGKLEAVHTDGTVMAVEVAANTHDPDDRQPIKVWPAPSDLALWFALDGSHPEEPWRIRNVVPPMYTYTVRPEDEAALLASDPLSRSTPDERAVAPAIVERMRKLVEQMANDHYDLPRHTADEARAIVAALEPVDENDKLASELAYKEGWRTFDTGWDSVVRVAHACLKRGRQLEKEGK